jgi:hypothetical protein
MGFLSFGGGGGVTIVTTSAGSGRGRTATGQVSAAPVGKVARLQKPSRWRARSSSVFVLSKSSFVRFCDRPAGRPNRARGSWLHNPIGVCQVSHLMSGFKCNATPALMSGVSLAESHSPASQGVSALATTWEAEFSNLSDERKRGPH